MQLSKKLYILLNFLPYFIFGVVGIAANISEYYLGESVSDIATASLWLFWVFPLYIIFLSICYKGNLSEVLMVGRGVVLAGLFFLVGVVMMFGFASFRVWLGMPI